MQKLLLLGCEAIAQAGIDAGLSGIYAYPGTPSTEIAEFIQHSKEAKEKNIRCNWSANEKTAMEAALGMSYAGKRAMVSMKHVGLNVAADSFVNSAITGANGGLIVVSADDPSMHSSQNEQDSRFYGKFSLIPYRRIEPPACFSSKISNPFPEFPNRFPIAGPHIPIGISHVRSFPPFQLKPKHRSPFPQNPPSIFSSHMRRQSRPWRTRKGR